MNGYVVLETRCCQLADIVGFTRALQVSAWVTHIIINQSSHDDRKAILSCILRLLQSCWNIGNFNAVAEIVNGLKYVNASTIKRVKKGKGKLYMYSATSGNCSCSGAVRHRQNGHTADRP